MIAPQARNIYQGHADGLLITFRAPLSSAATGGKGIAKDGAAKMMTC